MYSLVLVIKHSVHMKISLTKLGTGVAWTHIMHDRALNKKQTKC